MTKVAVVDMGGGNLGSVRFALERLGIEPCITGDAATIRSASHVLLPGVGAAAPAMRRLRELGLIAVLRGLDQPLLGICLGMQLLHEHSAEEDVEGLALLPGRVKKLRPAEGLRVPHMGWNTLSARGEDSLLQGIPPRGAHVYFVHGYGVTADANTVATVNHGRAFVALERRGNVCGMQFHPERSGVFGARLLKNFLAL